MIDTAINTVVATVPVGGMAVAVTPDGKHAYVTGTGLFTDSVIDTRTNKVVATIQGEPEPNKVAITPDGKRVYVTATNVSVIDTAINTVVATVTVRSVPFGVAVTPDGKHVYVANLQNPGFVSVIDTTSNAVVATVPVGSVPGWGRRHPGWKTRLCREWERQHCLGDRHGHQHSCGHGRGGV